MCATIQFIFQFDCILQDLSLKGISQKSHISFPLRYIWIKINFNEHNTKFPFFESCIFFLAYLESPVWGFIWGWDAKSWTYTRHEFSVTQPIFCRLDVGRKKTGAIWRCFQSSLLLVIPLSLYMSKLAYLWDMSWRSPRLEEDSPSLICFCKAGTCNWPLSSFPSLWS